MGRFCPDRSLLAGMDTGVLQARLTQMQTDYLDLVSGRKAESGTYAQADGSRAITYTKANIGDLAQAIRLLQAQLQVIDSPRRPMRVRFIR